MRFFITLGMALASLPLLAEYHLKLETYDAGPKYQLILTVDEWNESGLKQPVVAKTQTHGTCKGVYEINANTGMLKLEFDGTNGPGTTGGCNDESFTSDISDLDMWDIYWGASAPVKIQSRMFPTGPRLARVSMVD